MSDTKLRAEIMKLAHDNPEARKHLVPILKKTSSFEVAPVPPIKGVVEARLIHVKADRPTEQGAARVSGMLKLHLQGSPQGLTQTPFVAVFDTYRPGRYTVNFPNAEHMGEFLEAVFHALVGNEPIWEPLWND